MDDNKMKAPEEQSSVNEAADTSAEAAAAEKKAYDEAGNGVDLF